MTTRPAPRSRGERSARRSVAAEGARVLDVEPPLLGRTLAVGAARSAVAMARRRGTVAASDLPATRLRTSVTAEPGRLSAYQHLVGEPARDVLPAGFVHVLAFPLTTALLARTDFPLPLLGMVHVANEVTQLRPMTLGEPLTVEVHPRDLRAHRRGVTVDVVAEVAGADGAPAWRGSSRYLATGMRLTGAAAGDATGAAEDGPLDPATTTGGVRDAGERGPGAWHPPMPTAAWRLPSDLGRRYAAVSGDHNPIHTSSLAARTFGFPRTIAHGMYTAARALALVAPRADAFTWTATFHKPVLLPGTVAVAETRDGDTAVVDVWSGAERRQLEVRVTPH